MRRLDCILPCLSRMKSRDKSRHGESITGERENSERTFSESARNPHGCTRTQSGGLQNGELGRMCGVKAGLLLLTLFLHQCIELRPTQMKSTGAIPWTPFDGAL